MTRKSPISDLHDWQSEDGRVKVGSFVLNRNTGMDPTPAGTREVSVVVSFSDTSSDKGRMEAESYAREVAIDTYKKRWGPIEWDNAEFIGAHLTFQVIYALKVVPRD